MLVLLLVIFLSFRDGEYGLPALTGTAVAIILGPVTFYFSSRRRPKLRAENDEPKTASRKLRAEKSEPTTSS